MLYVLINLVYATLPGCDEAASTKHYRLILHTIPLEPVNFVNNPNILHEATSLYVRLVGITRK